MSNGYEVVVCLGGRGEGHKDPVTDEAESSTDARR